MKLTLRPGKESDAAVSGEIAWRAFAKISEQHNFQPDFPSAEVGVGLLKWILSRPDIYSVVAEADGKIIGSNFL